jgi:hypothetical protein
MLHSLLQFPSEEVMQFQVTEIEFDFDDEELSSFDKDEITSQYVGDVWEADDEEDLVEEITAASGWCIKSIDYRHILS